jgi:hypothetical protein
MDAAALERMRGHFRRPSEPMGEAWFMAEEREMYPQLLGDLENLPADEIQRPMAEIASGYSCFGPMDEWNEWFHYLLPQMLPRCHDGSISASFVETLITGYIALYPNGVHSAPYKTFREDTLRTLGRCMMEPQCWDGRKIVIGEMLRRDNRNPAGVWLWWDASGDFSASMFFCLKYLPKELVLGWMRSVLEIPDPHWRAQVMVWAVGAHDMLAGKLKWPAEFKERARPAVSWDRSYCLGSELAARDESGAKPMPALLPDAAREDALHILHAYFNEDAFLGWIESISQVDYLHAELAEIPATFELLFVRKPKSPDDPRIILL